MEKELAKLISARKANEKTFYIYKGVVYAYGKIKKLKHEERFRRICKADNYEEKLKDDIKLGMKVEIIE